MSRRRINRRHMPGLQRLHDKIVATRAARKKEEPEVPAPSAPSDETPFTGPYWHVDACAELVSPWLGAKAWTRFADIYDKRDTAEFAPTWARMLLASCHEQMGILCCVYAQFNPKEDENIHAALTAFIKVGLFPSLMAYASNDPDTRKRAKAEFTRYYTGFTVGRQSAK